MRIVQTKMSRDVLQALADQGCKDRVLGVVDVEKEIFAIDGDLHADLQASLLQTGSRLQDLWGFLLFPEQDGDAFLQFRSTMNYRPWQNNKTFGISDPAVREKVIAILGRWFA